MEGGAVTVIPTRQNVLDSQRCRALIALVAEGSDEEALELLTGLDPLDAATVAVGITAWYCAELSRAWDQTPAELAADFRARALRRAEQLAAREATEQ